MQVCLLILRRIEVHHTFDTIDVDSPRRNIGCDESFGLAVLEIPQSPITLSL